MSAFPLVAPESLPWLSVAQMREVDQVMAEELGITLARMMENTGRNLALLARLLLGGDASGRHVLVLAGPGGNGGGGLVATRHLVVAGADVEVRLSHSPEELAPITAEQLAIVQSIGATLSEVPTADLGEPELVLDCLLGYGQAGAPRGATASLIERSPGLRVLALDVPSGSSSRPESCTTHTCARRPRSLWRAPSKGCAPREVRTPSECSTSRTSLSLQPSTRVSGCRTRRHSDVAPSSVSALSRAILVLRH